MIDYTLPLDQLPDPLPIAPLTKPFNAAFMPPGSKSITCRAYVLAALAHGESRLIRPLRSDDTDHLLAALCTLGAQARWVSSDSHDAQDVLIKGVGERGGRFPHGGNLYMGEGGAPTRFIIACACLADQPVTIDASPRMRERPVAEGIDLLRQLGADIQYVEQDGRLPVRVHPLRAVAGCVVKVASLSSSQAVSAIILISAALGAPLTLEFAHAPPSASYIHLTLDCVRQWTSPLRRWGFHRFKEPQPIAGSLQLRPLNLQASSFFIDCDASSSLYWMASSLMVPSSSAHINGLGDNLFQPDLAAIRSIARACDAPDFGPFEVLVHGPAEFQSFNVDASDCPDGAVMLAVASAMGQKPSRITGLRTLRCKESDRLAALDEELRRIGCTIQAGDDWITIDPSTRHDHPVTIQTRNDHRIAMAFAVLGLARPSISIRNPACVRKSYPAFWSDFARLYR